MNYTISNHVLAGAGVQTKLVTGKDSGPFRVGLPDTIVIHFTAGGSAQSSVEHLSAPDVKASAHVVIGRDGAIYQLVGFDRIAWHAGESSWNGRSGLNHYSIGIELDNAGQLTKSGEGFVSWFGRRYPADEAVEAKHRNQTVLSFWHTYTEPQIEACFGLCRALLANYGIQTIVGHEEIAPGRKTDPGPAFPLDKLRDQLLIGRINSPTASQPAAGPSTSPQPTVKKMEVTASKLNVRQLPSAGSALAGEPLLRGTQVTVLEQSGGWCKISSSPVYWVLGEYLRSVN